MHYSFLHFIMINPTLIPQTHEKSVMHDNPPILTYFDPLNTILKADYLLCITSEFFSNLRKSGG